jgi:hypothetical protein
MSQGNTPYIQLMPVTTLARTIMHIGRKVSFCPLRLMPAGPTSIQR